MFGGWSEMGFDVPLTEVWVGGAILIPVDRIDTYDIALVLDAPADDVSWRTVHPAGAWIADRLRLTKMPVTCPCGPPGDPLDGRLRTMARVWSTAGPDLDTSTGSVAAISTDALEERRTGDR